jgi:hypothetical protein
MAPEDAAGMMKQVASGITPGTIEMDLSGQARDFYRQSMSLIMPICEKSIGGEKVRFLYPEGSKGFAGYTRFSGLAKEEPAHLGKLFAKIKGNQPGGK